jgi:hypothetical protein
MEAMHSSETSVLTRVTRRYIPEDGILQLYWCSRPWDTNAFSHSFHIVLTPCGRNVW